MPALVNGASTTLAANILSTDTSLTLATGTGAMFPSGDFYITIDDGTNQEIVYVPAAGRSGDTLSSLRRAAESYAGARTARGFSIGATISQTLTAAGLSAMVGSPQASAGGLQPIQTVSPSSAGSVTITVPSGYKNLRLTGLSRSDAASGTVYLQIRFNGDTGANYDSYIYQTDQVASGPLIEALAATQGNLSMSLPASALANNASSVDVIIPSCSEITFQKSWRGQSEWRDATSSGELRAIENVGVWRNTAAITSITLLLSSGNFVLGSTFTLWGESDTALVNVPTSNLLAEVVVPAGGQTPVVFNNIPQGYRDLRVVWTARGTVAGTGNTAHNLTMNGITSTYVVEFGETSGTTAGMSNSGSTATATSIPLGALPNAGVTPTSMAGSGELTIPNYSNPRSLLVGFTGRAFWSDNVNLHTDQIGGTVNTTSPITTLSFQPAAGSYAADTVFRLYGEPIAVSPMLATNNSNLLSETMLTAAQASITISGISQNFRDLRIVFQGRGDTAAAATNLNMQLNGDAGTNYTTQNHYADGTASTTSQQSAQTVFLVGSLAAASAAASLSTSGEIRLPNYTNTSFYRHISSHMIQDGTTTQIDWHDGYWANTAAVTSITLSPAAGNFVAGTVVRIYGEPIVTTSLSQQNTALATASSNLIQETVLTAAQSSIAIPTIPQNYKDLRITVQARGDTAATFIAVSIQFNGDTGANYASEQVWGSASTPSAQELLAQTGIKFGDISAATAPANDAGIIVLDIPNYSGNAYNKSISSRAEHRRATTTNNLFNESYAGTWTNTAAITSALLTVGAGNFAAGSIVRVYGEPASAAGISYGTGTRLRNSSAQAAATGTPFVLGWDTEDLDADNQHFTSTTALTGTVAKTAGSQTLTGTGTAFNTQLAIGQVISVPGVATEQAVVVAIASATSLTVATPFANTASGQTATPLNSAIVFRQPGMYLLELGIYSGPVPSQVTLQMRLNGSTIISQKDLTGINGITAYDLTTQRQFQQWDYVEALWTQSSGGSVSVQADERTHFSCNSRPTVIVAVPYVCIQDQKPQNTAGGTFSSGAWQTRTLNTVVSDVAGISSLSGNTIILPPGTYRAKGSAPANNVNNHQARLQNTTDNTTLLNGTSEYAGAATVQSRSHVEGKFTLTASKALQLQHQCNTTAATSGFGSAANFGTEVYTSVEIWKEG